jgi:hypothetical protein
MTTPVAFESVAVEPGALRLGDQTLPLRQGPMVARRRAYFAEVTWCGVGYLLRA